MNESAETVWMMVANTSGTSFLLRKTDLPEAQVWGLLLVVGIAAVLALRRRTSMRTVGRAFAASAAVVLTGLVILAQLRFKAFQALTEEGHLLEWLTAHFMLVASGVALVAAIRLSRRGQPSPLAALLSAGFFIGCARELEWGEPFVGDKAWYSRNLLRWEAYVDPSYHQRLNESLKTSFEATLATHLIYAAAFALILSAAGVYIFRHRKAFAAEVRAARRHADGRLLAAGAAIYLGSQGLGWVFKKALVSRHLIQWRKDENVGHRIIDEPLELLGAACFLLAAIFLFKNRLQTAEEGSRTNGTDIALSS